MPFSSVCPVRVSAAPGDEREGDQDRQGGHTEKQKKAQKEVPLGKGLIAQIAQPNLEKQDYEDGDDHDREVS